MDEPRIRASEKQLELMLLLLSDKGLVTLDPSPPLPHQREGYRADRALPTSQLDTLLNFRSIHPLYATFLLSHLGIADRWERIQALESVLELPRPLMKHVRAPWPENLPDGPLAEALAPELISRGLIAAPIPRGEDEEEDDDEEWQPRPPTIAEKLRLLFDATWGEMDDLSTSPVWSAGDLLRGYGGNFNLYIRGKDLTKQEGLIFRHLLRLILLCGEFAQVTPAGIDAAAWQAEMREVTEALTASCRAVDPESTDQMIQSAHAADFVEGESHAQAQAPADEASQPGFAAGVFDD
jgi:hypothetical protein